MGGKLVDVARLSGVSTATVSRVINESGYVSTKTREAVTKAIEELNYRPMKAASYLASRRLSFKIGVVTSERILRFTSTEPDEFYSVALSGIKEYLAPNNCSIEMLHTSNTSSIKDFDGFLLMGGEITRELTRKIKATGKPLVLVDQYIPGIKVDCVISDGYDGAHYAVDYLLGNSLRKIVHIHGPLSHFGFKDRYDGYVAAMERRRYLPKTYEYDEQNDNMEAIVDLMLKSYGVPEAVFGANDTIAIRALEVLKKRSLSIPDDVSVVGFDDIVSASFCNPPLTTLKIFKHEMGTMAARRIYNLLMREDTHPVKIMLFTEFVRRDSSL